MGDGSISRTMFIYNDAGQILETRFRHGELVTRIIRSYDSAGRLARTVTIDEKGASSASEIYSYDSNGRKTKIQFLPKVAGNVAYSVDVEGAAALFGASGAATMTTVYDDHDQATEVLVHDAAHQLLRRMTVTRDKAGRWVKQEVQAGTTPVFREFENKLKDAPPEARESLQAALAAAFGPNNVLVTITSTYDEKGRRVERSMTMGTLGGDRTTFHFDDHDNPVEEISEHAGRDVGMDEQANPRYSNETAHAQHSRYVYKYDVEENWTEREVWTNFQPGGDLKRSNIERREITYYQSALH
jgi:hypothetical protein